MDSIKLPILCLNDLINSRGFESFTESKLGNDLFINDPERADRIYEAAKEGTDGSYTSEVIEDWREYLELLPLIDPDDEGDNKPDAISEEVYCKIEDEIDEVEKFHEMRGTLWEQGS